MSDPWTTAWEEAEATAPPGVTQYDTIELQHPAFVEGSTPVPIRCVTGVVDDVSLGIEPGATYDGGQMATFKAVPFYADRPEFAEGRLPQCTITVDNVGRELAPRLKSAVQVKADLLVIYRQFRSDDTSEPCFGPVQFVMRNVKIKGTTVTGTAMLDDLANRKFPRHIASVREFPGLITG